MVKALSVRQPYATLIAAGHKTIETRTWSTRYRGSLLICSSRRPKNQGPTGVALAVVELSDCRKMTPSDERRSRMPWREDLFSWVLKNIRALKPRPVYGALGLWPYWTNCTVCRNYPTWPDCDPQCSPNINDCMAWFPADSLFLNSNQEQEGSPLG